MHNFKLLLISLGVIAVLAGIPHLLANQSKPNYKKVSIEVSCEPEESSKVVHEYGNGSLLGKWKVNYDSGGFKGIVINEITKNKGKMVGVTVAYLDEYGNSQEANDTILEITLESFNNYKGVYQLDYEGESYKVPCKIQSISESRLKLSYDYHGYADIEIWNKTP